MRCLHPDWLVDGCVPLSCDGFLSSVIWPGSRHSFGLEDLDDFPVPQRYKKCTLFGIGVDAIREFYRARFIRVVGNPNARIDAIRKFLNGLYVLVATNQGQGNGGPELKMSSLEFPKHFKLSLSRALFVGSKVDMRRLESFDHGVGSHTRGRIRRSNQLAGLKNNENTSSTGSLYPIPGTT